MVENELSKISKEKAEEIKKKKEDDLWNQFMKDVTPNNKVYKLYVLIKKFIVFNQTQNKNTDTSEKETKSNENCKTNTKVKVVEEFKFAGEIIR